MVLTSILVATIAYLSHKWIGELRRADELQYLVNTRYRDRLGEDE